MLDHLGSSHMSSSPIQVAVRQVEGLPMFAPLFGDSRNYVLMVSGLALLPSIEEVNFRYREHCQGKERSWKKIGQLGVSIDVAKKKVCVYLHRPTVYLIPTDDYLPVRWQVTEQPNGVF